ncbi:MAG: hypothetical protein RL653_2721 [Pseudomonadota bacterium]
MHRREAWCAWSPTRDVTEGSPGALARRAVCGRGPTSLRGEGRSSTTYHAAVNLCRMCVQTPTKVARNRLSRAEPVETCHSARKDAPSTDASRRGAALLYVGAHRGIGAVLASCLARSTTRSVSGRVGRPAHHGAGRLFCARAATDASGPCPPAASCGVQREVSQGEWVDLRVTARCGAAVRGRRPTPRGRAPGASCGVRREVSQGEWVDLRITARCGAAVRGRAPTPRGRTRQVPRAECDENCPSASGATCASRHGAPLLSAGAHRRLGRHTHQPPRAEYAEKGPGTSGDSRRHARLRGIGRRRERATCSPGVARGAGRDVPRWKGLTVTHPLSSTPRGAVGCTGTRREAAPVNGLHRLGRPFTPALTLG